MLLTRHNLTYYADLMAELRTAIRDGRVAGFAPAVAQSPA
jgi:queuine/archaeosine tRNA-ribosyltransferase